MEEVPFQAVKTWKQSDDPDYEAKKNWVLELYDIAEGKATPGPGDPTVVFSMDEFGPPLDSRAPTPVYGLHVGGDAHRVKIVPNECTATAEATGLSSELFGRTERFGVVGFDQPRPVRNLSSGLVMSIQVSAVESV